MLRALGNPNYDYDDFLLIPEVTLSFSIGGCSGVHDLVGDCF
jgi:hypothetical protein